MLTADRRQRNERHRSALSAKQCSGPTPATGMPCPRSQSQTQSYAYSACYSRWLGTRQS